MRGGFAHIAALPLAIAALMPSSGPAGPSSLTPDDARIGAWDGKTASAALSGPYEDRIQAAIPFGRRSFYLAPWRAYMDTWPASRLLEASGINFNVDPKEADAVAQMLAEAGIRSARIEIGWGNFTYDDPSQMTSDAAARFTAILKALKSHGIRPLILLNANSGAPCPFKILRVDGQQAAAGATAITVSQKYLDAIVPGKTGLRGMAYQTAFPIITSVDKTTGLCRLSAPLPKAVAAGVIELTVLKYEPFSGAEFADGSPNPAAEETLNGWLKYVGAACYFARDRVGIPETNEAGFDLEVWNEYTFGSQFLDVANYYKPAPKFKSQLTFTEHGRTIQGAEVILPRTIEFVHNPQNGLIGIGIINGFSNQRPWDNGAESWTGQLGFSRHYYTNIELKPLSKSNDPQPTIGPLSALDQPDGKPDGKDWNTVYPGSFFVPTVNVSMPEMWHYGYKTEFITRDLQPFPGPMKNHFRYAAPETGAPAQVWMTETNTWRKPWMDAVVADAGCRPDDVRAIALSQAVGARALLRSLVFQSHKGVRKMELFAAKDDDLGFAFFPSDFYRVLAANNYVLNDKVRAEAGPQWNVLKRLTTLLKLKPRLERDVSVPRPLAVQDLVEYKPRLVFKGDGTLAHPDRFNRDDFAVLPFQISENRYAVGCYVVTHNLVHEWNPSKPRLDAARYTMPDQEFDLTLANLRGTGAQVSLYDPLTDKSSSVRIVKSSRSSITVHLQVTDTPRFLMITESRIGVVIRNPRLQYAPGNRMNLSFETSIPCSATISWGDLPERTSERQVPARLGASARMTVPLPTKNPQGVKILLDFDGLKARWPIWNDDVQGRLPMATPVKQGARH